MIFPNDSDNPSAYVGFSDRSLPNACASTSPIFRPLDQPILTPLFYTSVNFMFLSRPSNFLISQPPLIADLGKVYYNHVPKHT